jgi:hypothetical protein
MSGVPFNREHVKIVRDGMKSRYKSREPCYICGSSENIELHHIYSVAELWNTWVKVNKIVIENNAEVVSLRRIFEAENSEKLSNDNLFSLCKNHHARLHQLYGKSYSNYMGDKVRLWIEKQRIKHGEDTK